MDIGDKCRKLLTSIGSNAYCKLILILLISLLIMSYFHIYILRALNILPSSEGLLISVFLLYASFFIFYDITLSRKSRVASRLYVLAFYMFLLIAGIVFFTGACNAGEFLMSLFFLIIVIYFICFIIKYRNIYFRDLLRAPEQMRYKEEGDCIKVIEHEKEQIDIASNIKGILPKIDKYPEVYIRGSYYVIFECYYKMGDYDNAIIYLERLIEVDTDTKKLIYTGLDFYELIQGIFHFTIFKHNIFSKYLKYKSTAESFVEKNLTLKIKIEYILAVIFILTFLFYSISTLTFDYTTSNTEQISLNYDPIHSLFLFSIFICIIILLLYVSLKIENGYANKIFDYVDHSIRNQKIEIYLAKESNLKRIYKILYISLPFTCVCLTFQFTTWFTDVSMNLIRISIHYVTEGTFLISLIYFIMYFILMFVFLLLPFIVFIYTLLTISVFKDFVSSSYYNLTDRTIHESELAGYYYSVLMPSCIIAFCLIIFSVFFVITLENPTYITQFLAPVSLSLFLVLFMISWIYYEFTIGSSKLIGDTYYNEEKYAEACDRYEKVEKHVNNRFYKILLPPSDTFLSNLYMAYGDSKFRLGEKEEALTLLNKSLEHAEKGNLTSYLWQIHYKIGQIKEEENILEEAYENYKKSIDRIEDLRELVKIPERKEAFFENKAEVYVRMVFLCLKLGKDEEAFNYAERAKGRVFLELLGTAKVKSKASPELKEKEEEFQRKIRAIEAKLRGSRGAGERHLKELGEIMQEYDTHLLRIKEEDPDYYSLRKVDPLTIKEVQGLLKEDELLLEFFIGEKPVVFLIQKDSFGVVEIPMSKEELIDKTGLLRERIKMVTSVKRISKEIYSSLIKPLEPMLNGKELIIVPHGVLHYLPFNALHDGRKWFVEKYKVRFLQNASMLRFLEGKGKGKIETAFVIGNPTRDLEYSEVEANEIADNFNIEPLLRDEATKDAVIEGSKGKDILHFSCHGMFEAGIPRFSRLMLADGNLLALEVYNLDLSADLVVLSACQTGLGGLTSGDEIEGLTRAFMRAGTPSVIASLWSVDDESTSELFLRYYEGEGDKVERLRRAQIETMREYRHPFYWAGFVMFGGG